MARLIEVLIASWVSSRCVRRRQHPRDCARRVSGTADTLVLIVALNSAVHLNTTIIFNKNSKFCSIQFKQPTLYLFCLKLPEA